MTEQRTPNNQLPTKETRANSGKEGAISTVQFQQLALQIYDERVAHENKPRQMMYFFAGTRTSMDGPHIPTIGFYCNPSFIDHSETKINLLGIDSLQNSRIGIHSILGIDLDDHTLSTSGPIADNVAKFRVYDFDVDKLGDPNVIDDLLDIDPAKTLVAATIDDARRVNGWVADPRIRARIHEWMSLSFPRSKEDYNNEFIYRQKQAKKYIQLRKAPFNKETNIYSSLYTYDGIKEEVIHGHRSLVTLNGKREIEYDFTQADLEWLEEFMKNKGIPIPEK